MVLGDDIISRQGMLMMDDLKIQILQTIHETKVPKVTILLNLFMHSLKLQFSDI